MTLASAKACRHRALAVEQVVHACFLVASFLACRASLISRNHLKSVLPGTATGASAIGAVRSRFLGKLSSVELIASSQVITSPLYAAIRPRIASMALLGTRCPALIGLP